MESHFRYLNTGNEFADAKEACNFSNDLTLKLPFTDFCKKEKRKK